MDLVTLGYYKDHRCIRPGGEAVPISAAEDILPVIESTRSYGMARFRGYRQLGSICRGVSVLAYRALESGYQGVVPSWRVRIVLS